VKTAVGRLTTGDRERAQPHSLKGAQGPRGAHRPEDPVLGANDCQSYAQEVLTRAPRCSTMCTSAKPAYRRRSHKRFVAAHFVAEGLENTTAGRDARL
jgi:hypothetical protein